MESKIVMLKESDSGPQNRGQSGKQKVYELTDAYRFVTFSWGMAEKTKRQTQTIVCVNNQHAKSVANEKKFAKLDRGYRIAYAV